MKFWLFVSIPSAIHATLTPAPVMPSERAVGCALSSESTPVRARPSGSSSGALAFELHAPGIVLSGGELALVVASSARKASELLAGAAPSEIVESGSTRATSGSAARRARSARDTVAANESTRVKSLTCVACVARS